MRKNVYQRFAERVAADANYAARAAKAGPDHDVFAWLAGEWTWELRILATGTTPARTASGTILFAPAGYGISASRPSKQAVPYLIHDPFTNMWVCAMAEPTAYGILMGSGWKNERAVFVGEMTFMGVPMKLRQTWTREGTDTVRLHNEEMIDGEWTAVDEGSYHRIGK